QNVHAPVSLALKQLKMFEPLARANRGEQCNSRYDGDLMTVVVNKALAQFSQNLGCSRRIRVVRPIEEHDVHKRAPERVRNNIGILNLASLSRIHLTLKYPCAFSKNNPELLRVYERWVHFH